MTKYVDTEYGQICISTGEVLEYRESVSIQSTATTSHGAYNSSTTHSTSSTSTLKVAMREKDGTEKHVSLGESLQVGIRAGNKLTVIWFVPTGKKTGPYVLAYNHDTRDLRKDRVPVLGAQIFGCLLALGIVLGIGLLFAGDLSILGFLVLGGLGFWIFKLKQKGDAIMQLVNAEFELVRSGSGGS